LIQVKRERSRSLAHASIVAAGARRAPPGSADAAAARRSLSCRAYDDLSCACASSWLRTLA
jgi:hypothetical protein